MADYSISTEVTLDDSKFSKGVKNAQKSTKKLSSVLSNVTKGFGKGGLLGAVSGAGLALGGIGLAVGVAVKSFQKLSKAIGECTDAYKKQLNAERALDTAIQNSPIMTESSSRNLKEFASQMQRTSNIGDEELLPMMSQLVATGRSEAEVMKIIQTATDMSATGTISLETAVTQLNATLNGNVGRLGQQNAELKGLTEEELKNGKAVDILASKYKGMAENTIDTSKQLKNAIGDLKEAYGQAFENALAPVRKYFTTIIQGWADAKKAREEYDKAEKAKESGTATGTQLILYYQQQLKYIADERLVYEGMYGADLEMAQAKLKELELEEQRYKSLIATEKYRIKLSEDAKLSEAEKQELLDKEKEKEEEIAKLKEKYLLKIAEQEARWKNIETVTGEVVSKEEKLKFYQDELVNIMTEAGGEITTNNQYYKDQVAIIERIAKGIGAVAETSDEWKKKLLAQRIEMLEQEKEVVIERLKNEEATEKEIYEVQKEFALQIIELKKQQIEEEMEIELSKVQKFENAEEEMLRIREYYQNKKMAMIQSEAVTYKETNDGVITGTISTWDRVKGIVAENGDEIKAVFKQIGKEVIETFKKMISELKKVAKGIVNIFKNLFKLDIDDALDSILAFEDSVLTFFVETLPKLPQFVSSVMQSISVLLQSILSSGGLLNLGEILSSILSDLMRQIPQIINAVVPVVKAIMNAVISSLSNMNIFESLLDMIVDGIEWILDKLVSALPIILKGLIGLIEKLLKKLPQLIKIILPAITKIITTIVKALPSLLKAVIPNLLKAVLELVKGLLKEMPTIISVIIEVLPEIVSAVVEGLSEFLSSLSGKDIAVIISGVIKATALIAGSLIKNIGKIVAELIPVMIQLVVELVKSVPDIVEGMGTGTWEGLQDVGEAVWSGLKTAGEAVKETGKKIVNGVKKLFGFATGTNDAPKGLALVGEAGPELVRFRGGEQVLNTRNTQKALAGVGGNTNNFNVVFNNLQDTSAYAMMSQLRAYNRNLAINGII